MSEETAMVKLTVGDKIKLLRMEEDRLLEEVAATFPEDDKNERPRVDQLELDVIEGGYVVLLIDCTEDGYNPYAREIERAKDRLAALGIDQVSVMAGTDDFYVRE